MIYFRISEKKYCAMNKHSFFLFHQYGYQSIQVPLTLKTYTYIHAHASVQSKFTHAPTRNTFTHTYIHTYIHTRMTYTRINNAHVWIRNRRNENSIKAFTQIHFHHFLVNNSSQWWFGSIPTQILWNVYRTKDFHTLEMV